MNLQRLEDSIKRNEGFRDVIYLDSMTPPNKTLGYGHLVKPDENFIEGKRYNRKVINRIFQYDFVIAQNDCKKLTKGMDLPDEAMEVVCELAYQLGINRLKKFVKFFGFLKQKKYVDAGFELENSLLYRQCRERTSRHAERIKGLGV